MTPEAKLILVLGNTNAKNSSNVLTAKSKLVLTVLH